MQLITLLIEEHQIGVVVIDIVDLEALVSIRLPVLAHEAGQLRVLVQPADGHREQCQRGFNPNWSGGTGRCAAHRQPEQVLISVWCIRWFSLSHTIVCDAEAEGRGFSVGDECGLLELAHIVKDLAVDVEISPGEWQEQHHLPCVVAGWRREGGRGCKADGGVAPTDSLLAQEDAIKHHCARGRDGIQDVVDPRLVLVKPDPCRSLRRASFFGWEARFQRRLAGMEEYEALVREQLTSLGYSSDAIPDEARTRRARA